MTPLSPDCEVLLEVVLRLRAEEDAEVNYSQKRYEYGVQHGRNVRNVAEI